MGFPGRGDQTFLGGARIGWGPLFPKNIGLGFGPGFWDGGGGGWDLQKIQSVWGFRKDFPHLWALPVQIRKGWGPLMWPKWGYRENPPDFFYRIFFSLHTGGPWAHSGPIQLPINPPWWAHIMLYKWGHRACSSWG